MHEELGSLLEFLRDLIPTQFQIELGTAASVFGGAASYILGWNGPVEALLAAMVIDYITGIIAAGKSKKPKVNSKKLFRGIGKKLTILCIVSFFHFLDKGMGTDALHGIAVWFYLGNEGLSIIENAAKIGVPIPRRLHDTLEQLTREKEEREGGGQAK